ncbi:MAG: DUF5343 domain-containing protein [Pyrinomonadaceae bacterium]
MSSTPENGNGTKKVIPPYLSHKTFNNFIDGLRTGIPARIDRSVMSSLSGTAQAHLLYALKYLNLVDAEGIPTEQLNQLATATDAEKQRILREVLVSAYPFVCNDGIDLERCTGKQIEEAFATTGASSETLRKSLAFFQATAKQAGMNISPHIKRTRRARGTGQRTRGGTASTRGGVQGVNTEPLPQNPAPVTQHPTGTTKTIQLNTGGSLTLSLAVNLLELKGKDREFVFKLIDELDEYETGNSEQASSE